MASQLFDHLIVVRTDGTELGVKVIRLAIEKDRSSVLVAKVQWEAATGKTACEEMFKGKWLQLRDSLTSDTFFMPQTVLWRIWERDLWLTSEIMQLID